MSSGVSTAETITAAATCTVATPAMPPYVGSAIAIALGTAAALPAVLDAAAPAIPEPPSAMSARMHTVPVTATTNTPSSTPDRPDETTECRLMFCPSVNAMNGMMIGSCRPKKSRMSRSRLPSTAPATIGAITDTMVSQGIAASPAPTRNSMVTNGPVSIDCGT